MKIFVIDLVGKRFSRAFIGIVLVLAVVIASVFGYLTRGFGESLIVQSADAIPYNKIVIIDAGHGGEDPGAVGSNGVFEKDINLAIALEMGKSFEEKGYVVVYTRTDDRLLYTEEENVHGIRKISDLKNRCKIAERYPESIFVSLHVNSFGSSKYSGLQVYYSPNSESSRELADVVQDRVVSDIQNDNSRKIKSGKDIYILENISNTSVLIECGFISNDEECKKLSEKEYQKELSFSIVCGIIDYMEKTSK